MQAALLASRVETTEARKAVVEGRQHKIQANLSPMTDLHGPIFFTSLNAPNKQVREVSAADEHPCMHDERLSFPVFHPALICRSLRYQWDRCDKQQGDYCRGPFHRVGRKI